MYMTVGVITQRPHVDVPLPDFDPYLKETMAPFTFLESQLFVDTFLGLRDHGGQPL